MSSEPVAADTDAQAEAAQRAVWARMGPSGRLALGLRMSDEVRELAITGLMARCPELTRREAELAIIRQYLGDALFREVYGSR